jgi:uncharacterized protein YlaI
MKTDLLQYSPTELRTCEICGAVMHLDDAKLDDPWATTWVCNDCRERVPEREIERLYKEVALRGVPCS